MVRPKFYVLHARSNCRVSVSATIDAFWVMDVTVETEDVEEDEEAICEKRLELPEKSWLHWLLSIRWFSVVENQITQL